MYDIPPVTSQEMAVQAADEAFVAAMVRRDLAAMMSVYTGDSVLLPPDGTLIRGKAAIETFWAGFIGIAAQVEVEHQRLSLHTEGDIAWEVSSYQQKILLKDGSTLENQGYWLTVRRRQADGTYKNESGAWTATGARAGEPAT
jgi:ketosteroid isomerase-like protein